jgi:hypothetical protein
MVSQACGSPWRPPSLPLIATRDFTRARSRHVKPTDRIPRGQGEELRLVGLDELGKNAARGGKLDIEQRRLLLRRGQQDELPVRPVGVEVKVIPELIPDLGRVSRQVDMKILERGFLARKMLERPVVAVDELRRGDLDEVPEHEALCDEAVHCLISINLDFAA